MRTLKERASSLKLSNYKTPTIEFLQKGNQRKVINNSPNNKTSLTNEHFLKFKEFD